MARWHGCWLLAMWLVLPPSLGAQEPAEIPRAGLAVDISKANEPLRLTRPGRSGTAGSESTGSARSNSNGWTTPVGSLVFVLALIAGGAYFIRRQGGRIAGLLPNDVLQVLGRRYIDQRQSIQLVRCGSKILVLANSSQHGLTTLAEITDPLEVERITAQCLPTTNVAVRSDSRPSRAMRPSHESSAPGGPHG